MARKGHDLDVIDSSGVRTCIRVRVRVRVRVRRGCSRFQAFELSSFQDVKIVKIVKIVKFVKIVKIQDLPISHRMQIRKKYHSLRTP